jgi:ribonuclease HI
VLWNLEKFHFTLIRSFLNANKKCESLVKVTMMWISSHAGMTGNEAANLEASQAISGELVDGRTPVAHGFLQNTRRVMIQNTLSK